MGAESRVNSLVEEFFNNSIEKGALRACLKSPNPSLGAAILRKNSLKSDHSAPQMTKQLPYYLLFKQALSNLKGIAANYENSLCICTA